MPLPTSTHVSSSAPTPASVQTMVWAPFGLSACLRNAENHFSSREWRTQSPQQRAFLDRIYGPATAVLDRIPEDQLRCIASPSAEDINAFLMQQGSGDIQLAPFQDSNSMGFAAVTKVLVSWAIPGTRTSFTKGAASFPAAKLKRGVGLLTSNGHTVAKIQGKDGTSAFLTPVAPFLANIRGVDSLVEVCSALERDAHAAGSRFEGVIFPMVDLNYRPDLSWLLEMELVQGGGKPAMFVRQAVQQLGFKLNHLGAAFRDEVAIEMAMRGIAPPPFRIEEPFLFWLSRPELSGLPLFAGVIGEDAWKDPGDTIAF